ncbi:MAG: 4Fe-4S dicluster domain-containing protein [Candidatus Verstraetearchaeota archaeon]|nr:4Fe-4S dicluster domain-containing protein [Candidatus Verstraetearchaeota archaeon]
MTLNLKVGGSYRLGEEDLVNLVASLIRSGFTVVAPVKEGEEVYFKVVDDEGKDDIALSYGRAVNSPREFLLPDGEVLYSYDVNTLECKFEFPKERMVFFGVHLCDANAIRYLDLALMSGSSPPDPMYKARRENSIVISVECSSWDDHCFCASVGGNRLPEGVVDLHLKPLSDGGYAVKVLSEKGLMILSMLDKELELYSDEWKPFAPRQRRYFDSMVLENLENEFYVLMRDAKGYVDLCVKCGNCTQQCPTCFCFDIQEQADPLRLSTYKRVRRKMSCQRMYFSLVSGDIVVLKEKEERFKWRLLHKFPFSKKRFGIWGCVGCGRCIAFCPAEIDMVRFLGGVVER